MKIKITFDPDSAYGYPKNIVMWGKQLVNDYISNLNKLKDADVIAMLNHANTEKAVDYVAQQWSLEYEFV